LDASGQLFDIDADPGQNRDVADKYPRVTSQLAKEARRHAEAMQKHFQQNADRPFHVGFGPSTTLPARDGVEHGTIRRSAKPPNNSFFTNWTSTGDFISWQVNVGKPGDYEAVVYYTCAAGDEGSTVRLSMLGGESVQAKVVEVFDPPLYDKSKERVEDSHYFVKDFRPLRLGTISLQAGRGELRLDSVKMTGQKVIDVHSIELKFISP
jgi:hypothetical protein